MAETMNALRAFKENNPRCPHPLCEFFANKPQLTDDDKYRFYLAARRLGFEVTRTHDGVIYEKERRV